MKDTFTVLTRLIFLCYTIYDLRVYKELICKNKNKCFFFGCGESWYRCCLCSRRYFCYNTINVRQVARELFEQIDIILTISERSGPQSIFTSFKLQTRFVVFIKWCAPLYPRWFLYNSMKFELIAIGGWAHCLPWRISDLDTSTVSNLSYATLTYLSCRFYI